MEDGNGKPLLITLYLEKPMMNLVVNHREGGLQVQKTQHMI